MDKKSAARYVGDNPEGYKAGDAVTNHLDEKATVKEIRGNVLYLDRAVTLNDQNELELKKS